MRMNQSLVPMSMLLLAAAAWASGLRADGQCTEGLAIFEIQGASHVSALDGEQVQTCGVVTAVAFNGYYLQDALGDGDDATSDGIFVSARDDLPPAGSFVSLQATVSEIIAGGADTGNLSTTTLVDVEELERVEGNVLPEPVLIGAAGRSPSATTVISDSEIQEGINLQLAEDAAITPFNPETDAIDFMESLEGMLVSVADPVAVSGIRQFGTFSAEVFVLADRGAHVAPVDALNSRGGIALQPHPDNLGDQNPERIQIQFDGTLFGSTDYPSVTVGDELNTVTGVMGYSFGNYEINATGPVTVSETGLQADVGTLYGSDSELLLASYNVLNLSAVDADTEQREAIAQQVVSSLNSPDIIALQEVQDNNGDISDCDDDIDPCAGVLDASQTLQALIDAIADAGGPVYDFINVDPLLETTDDNRENIDTFGGASLGNIRNAFLYNADRVRLLEHVGMTRDELAARGVSVSGAFDTSRDPLEAVFEFNGQRVTVLNNHFSSRFGSTPIYGGPQPFVQAGAQVREDQALAMHELAAASLESDPEAAVIVLGDLNTFEFSRELADTLSAASGTTLLHNLIDTLPDGDAYSFNFEGNSQALDHVFVSDALQNGAVVDYVNVNVDFPRLFSSTVASDHEPVLVSLELSASTPPTATLPIEGLVYSSTALEIFWDYATLDQTPVSVEVYRNDGLIASHDGRSQFQEGLTPGSDYDFRVIALDGAGDVVAEGSIELSTHDDGGNPSQDGVSDLSGLVYSTSALEIFWQPPADESGWFEYQVLRNGEQIAMHDGRSHFESGLQADTAYRYEVIAVDEQGVMRAPVAIDLQTPPQP